MSRKYEGLIVLKTQGVEQSVDEIISNIGKEIESEGVKLDSVDNLGRRKFAYTSQKREGGQYVNFTFLAEPTQIKPLNDRLKLNDLVHSQHYRVVEG